MITKMKSVLAMATVAMMVGTVWPSLAKTNELGWRKHSAYALPPNGAMALGQSTHGTTRRVSKNSRAGLARALSLCRPGLFPDDAVALARSLFGRRTWARTSGWIRSQRGCSLKGAAAGS